MLKFKFSYLILLGLLAFSCGEQDLVSNHRSSTLTIDKTSTIGPNVASQPSTGSCGTEETTTIFYDIYGGGQVAVTTTAIPCAGIDNPDSGPLPDVVCTPIVLPSKPTNGQKNYVTNSCWSGGLTLYYSSAASAWVYPSPNTKPTGAPASPYNGLNYMYNIPGTTQYYHYVYLTSVGFISTGWYVVYFSVTGSTPPVVGPM